MSVLFSQPKPPRRGVHSLLTTPTPLLEWRFRLPAFQEEIDTIEREMPWDVADEAYWQERLKDPLDILIRWPWNDLPREIQRAERMIEGFSRAGQQRSDSYAPFREQARAEASKIWANQPRLTALAMAKLIHRQLKPDHKGLVPAIDTIRKWIGKDKPVTS